MARRRFRSNQRHEPTTERSFQEYVLSTPAPQTSRTEILRLIRGGEDTFLELKVKLSNTEKIAQEIVALANTGGGVMVFGVNDQLRVEGVDDPEKVQDDLVRICREEVQPPLVPFIDRIALDNGRRIVALDIESKRRPYRTRDGRFYLRIGAEKREASREEISTLLDESRPTRYEDVPALGATMADVDEAHLWSYLREFEGGAFEEATVVGYPTADVLERDLLLAKSDGQEVVPSVAALLLFGRDERVTELLPRAAVTVTRFSGDSPQSPIVERVKLSGNLLSIYEGLMRFVRRYCDLTEVRPKNGSAAWSDDSPVPARSSYHGGVVAEAIANMLAHRDLALRDLPSRIHIFDRSLELVNSRRSVGFSPVAQKAIRYGMPERLNPRLAAVLTSSAYGLKLTLRGLPSLLRESKRFSNRKAEIVSFNDEFRLRIYGI
ncbi:MAG TPA: RNA-binding domain-containing protein [Pyrinomonadaceae bacterium]|jgi:ATP-dependent DNA helicase RecG|nr:RNA-binding domain-containing protein [Pyrinomonadaceae bacterium]